MINISWPDPALLWSCRGIRDVEVGYDPTACAHLIAYVRGRKQSRVTGRTPLLKYSALGDNLRSYTPAKENYPGYSSTGDRGIHWLLRGSVSSDTLLYLFDPEVLLSDFLLILKREFGSFGTVSSDRTQEKAWNDG